ncbi:phospholipid carrier-dependent glycosyltransferase [Leptolyngbya sp. BC1307]|uniref:phospholipid carrier-dependent glycosyltransferase n=1 Tax=Leptolyngbya sp. BC1307 TaxID=2029589 RepID=UPI000EFC3574|nr:phospholipid carrier-dependent glycosyltransferase [Leptolyngbya sp. BC1307]
MLKRLTRTRYYHLGLIAVVGLSFGLRFWQLSRFDALVFDEIYFVKFAHAYLTGVPQFDAHPPLGKYLIAAGIWLSAHWPFSNWPFTAAPEGLAPFSYRWMNALVGSFVPLVVMGIAYTLGRRQREAKRWTFTLLAGGFVAIDGLFVTESRYALINIYMVFFGLLGHWLWLQASIGSGKGRVFKGILRTLAAVALGAAVAVKWNGLGYWLSLLIWEAWRGKWFKRSQPLKALSKKALSQALLYGGFIPALTYSLIWWPHLYLSGERLLSLHAALFTFHQRLAASGHPDCSQWYTWPLLIKPIAYWYETVGLQAYTVNNLGNPALWWLSSSAVILLFIVRMRQVKNLLMRAKATPANPTVQNLSAYLLIGYAANWLPWMVISRCTFIYLYMPAAAFSFIMLAWLLSEWLHSPQKWVRVMALVMLGAIALSFFFWLPLSLGSPLTPADLKLRWWLKTWI